MLVDEILKKYGIQPYEMTEWKDHLVDPLEGDLLQQGTPISAKNLNKMELGIYNAYACLSLFGINKIDDALYELPLIIEHNLNRYPFVQVLKITDGAGYGEAGETPAGGENISIFARFSYQDKNNIKIFLPEIIENPVIDKVDDMTFIVNTDTNSYEISLGYL